MKFWIKLYYCRSYLTRIMFPFAVYVELILMITFWKIDDYDEVTITSENNKKKQKFKNILSIFFCVEKRKSYDLIMGIFSFQLVNEPLSRTSFTFLLGYLKTTGIFRFAVSTLAWLSGNLNIGIACVGLCQSKEKDYKLV